MSQLQVEPNAESIKQSLHLAGLQDLHDQMHQQTLESNLSPSHFLLSHNGSSLFAKTLSDKLIGHQAQIDTSVNNSPISPLPTTLNTSMSPTQLASSTSNLKKVASLKLLDKVEHHHVKNVENIESDPFAIKNLTENSKMANNYEITEQTTTPMQEQQQEEMFEDIADNTNPDFVAHAKSSHRLADAKLSFKPDDDFFRVRRDIMAQRNNARSSSTDRFFSKKAFDPFYNLNNIESVNNGDKADHHEVWSISDRDFFYEDENEEEDTRLILNILKLEKSDSEMKQIRQTRRQANSSVRQTCTQPHYTRNTLRRQLENEDSISDNFNPFSNRFAIEYEECGRAQNEGSCCGGVDFEDNGLDSTLSISIRDEVELRSENQDTDKKIERRQNQTRRNRSRINRVNFEQTASPFKKQSAVSVRRNPAPRLRQAFSQVNKDELAREQRMHDSSESIEDFEFAAMLEQAELNQGLPALVRHMSGGEFSQVRNQNNSKQLLPTKNNFMDMRKSSEPIQYSQHFEENQIMQASQQSIMSMTPRAIYEERKSSETTSNQQLPLQTPDSVVAYQMRQNSGFGFDYNVQSDSYANSSQIDTRPPIMTWKEDFVMSSALDMNRMSHVNPLVNSPNDYAAQIDSAYTAREFKILDDQEIKTPIATHLSALKSEILSSPKESVKTETSASVITSRSKGIKKSKAVPHAMADKSSSNRKQKKKDVESNLIERRNAKRKNKDTVNHESKDISSTEKCHLKYSQTQQGQIQEQEIVNEKAARISNKTDKSKYYQNFDFFFKRTCFRVMTEFYKDKFNSFYQKRMAQLKQDDLAAWQQLIKAGGITSLSSSEMDVIVGDFFSFIFGKGILNQQCETMLKHAMMILFSHRYTKNDRFICEKSIEFDIIRDVMYKYSKKAQDRYFSYPVECFMFAAFALSDEGQDFLRQKPDNAKDQDKLLRVLRDLKQLKDIAVESLRQFADQAAVSPSSEATSGFAIGDLDMLQAANSKGISPHCCPEQTEQKICSTSKSANAPSQKQSGQTNSGNVDQIMLGSILYQHFQQLTNGKV